MKCENCKQNEATFFYEERINGQKRQLHLCADCAAKLQVDTPVSPFGKMGQGLFEGLFGFSGAALDKAASKTCEGCGATWQQLRAAGKAFCPSCYLTFRRELEPTLRSLHGNVTHVGRAPAEQKAKTEKRDRLAALRAALEQAIKEENFENAATLRDEIRALEKKGEA